jgi:hypothetical protein
LLFSGTAHAHHFNAIVVTSFNYRKRSLFTESQRENFLLTEAWRKALQVFLFSIFSG